MRRAVGGRTKGPESAQVRPTGRKDGWSEKEGSPPGTLVYVGERKTETVRISIIDYDENNFLEKEVRIALIMAAFFRRKKWL
ncbi:MAG: hypothetical protein ABSA30_05940 [Candidatus Aminicenantales bacterium]|jgi:hypothetical protein